MTEENTGKTTIAPDVLITVARLATLQVPGVSRMAPVSGGVERFLHRGASEGVRIHLEDNIVYIDLYVILQNNINVRNVSREIQQSVARAIQEMIGMDIGHINIHVENIDYPQDAEVSEQTE